ncbi:MAG: DUF29 domain-containing protein [Alphaproteobacteria bacterium]
MRAGRALSSLDGTDFDAWADEWAQFLQEGKLAAADFVHIAAESESLGRGERRELINRLEGLLTELLKRAYHVDKRSRSSQVTIANRRDRLTGHPGDTPSLKAHRDGAVLPVCRRARPDIEWESGPAQSVLAQTWPWSLDRILHEAFWPR